MTSTDDEFDWPPPVCEPCRWGFHDHCRPIPFCECGEGDCLERLLEDQCR